MCFGGDDSASTAQSAGSASSNVTFTPTITIGGNSGDPNGDDTAGTFAAKLLAAPPVRIALPDPVEAAPEDNTTKLLTFVAVALVARKVLRG